MRLVLAGAILCGTAGGSHAPCASAAAHGTVVLEVEPGLYIGDEPAAYVRARSNDDSRERRLAEMICAAPLTYIPATSTHAFGRPALRRIFGTRCFGAPFRAVLAALDAESVLAMVVRAVVFYGTVGAVPSHVLPRDMVVLRALRRMQRVAASTVTAGDTRLTVGTTKPPGPAAAYTFRTGAKLQRSGPGSAVLALLVRQALRMHSAHWTRWALGAAVDEPRMLAAVVARVIEADDADAMARMLDADRECRASLQLGHVFAYRPALPLNGAFRVLLSRLDELPFHMADVNVLVARKRWDMLAYVAAGTHMGHYSRVLRSSLTTHTPEILAAVRSKMNPAFALSWLPNLVIGLSVVGRQSVAAALLREHVVHMPDIFERMLTHAIPALHWAPCSDKAIQKAVGAPRMAGLLAMRYAFWLSTAAHRERVIELEGIVATGADARAHGVGDDELALARSGRAAENVDPQMRQMLAHQIDELAAENGGEAALATAAFRGALRLVRPDIAACVASVYVSFEPGSKVVDAVLARHIAAMLFRIEDREATRLLDWVASADGISRDALRIFVRQGHATIASPTPSTASRSLLPAVRSYLSRNGG